VLGCVGEIGIARIRTGLFRVQAKALLLSKNPRKAVASMVVASNTPFRITVSELGTPEDSESRLHSCERRLEQIEAKLDRLLDIQLRSLNDPPLWFTQSSQNLLREIAAVGGQVTTLASDSASLKEDNTMLRREIEELAEGADRFLAGLQGKLTQREIELFWELIYSEANANGGRRCRSYAEIGKRLGGVTKQAVESRVKNLKRKHPDVWAYVNAIRNPEAAIPFSGLSPSERRKRGIDDAYNYDQG
jgi:hypothetical protein